MELIPIFLLVASLLALILALVAFSFSLYVLVRVLAWSKTEYKMIPLAEPKTSGLEELTKQLEEMREEQIGDLQLVDIDTDDLV